MSSTYIQITNAIYKFDQIFLVYSKLGPRLKVTALIDPAIERAQSVLQKKCDSFVVSAYQNTRIFRSLDEYIKSQPLASRGERPRAFVVGSPPMFRGGTSAGRDLELQILKAFPGVAMFIEKPIATGPLETLKEAWEVASVVERSGVVCSVGYVSLLNLCCCVGQANVMGICVDTCCDI